MHAAAAEPSTAGWWCRLWKQQWHGQLASSGVFSELRAAAAPRPTPRGPKDWRPGSVA